MTEKNTSESAEKVELTGEERFALASASMASWQHLTDETSGEVAYSGLAVAIVDAVQRIVARRLAREQEAISTHLQGEAVSRFDLHGAEDARGAAFWDAAAWIREERTNG